MLNLYLKVFYSFLDLKRENILNLNGDFIIIFSIIQNSLKIGRNQILY